MQTRAVQLRERFAAFEQATYGQEWTTNDLVIGLVKDVGDLAEIVQRLEGKRPTRSTSPRADLEHELGDCLWSLLVIADRFDIDVAQAYENTIGDISNWIDQQGSD